MSDLTLHRCHFHRAERPYDQEGNNNYLKGRGQQSQNMVEDMRQRNEHPMSSISEINSPLRRNIIITSILFRFWDVTHLNNIEPCWGFIGQTKKNRFIMMKINMIDMFWKKI